MLLATALALLITGCAQQTFTVQNKPAAVAPKETITHHFFVSGIGQKKTVDAAKTCARAAIVRQSSDCSVLLLGIYTRWSVMCIAYNNCMSCPSIRATLSALLIKYFWVPSSCFCIVISLWGWNNSVQRCLPVGEGCIIHAGGGGGFTHWLTDCFDVQPTTISGNIITQSIIFSFSIS